MSVTYALCIQYPSGWHRTDATYQKTDNLQEIATRKLKTNDKILRVVIEDAEGNILADVRKLVDKNNTPLKVSEVVLYKNRPHIIAKIIDGAICLQPLGRAKQFFVNPSQVEKTEDLQNENLAALWGIDGG